MKSQPSQLSSNQPPPGPDLRPRALWFFSISVTIVFLLLGVRLFYIQILAHDQHLSRARSGTGRTDSIPAYPGDLRTSDGVIVARSETAFSLVTSGKVRTATRSKSDHASAPKQRCSSR